MRSFLLFLFLFSVSCPLQAEHDLSAGRAPALEESLLTAIFNLDFSAAEALLQKGAQLDSRVLRIQDTNELGQKEAEVSYATVTEKVLERVKQDVGSDNALTMLKFILDHKADPNGTYLSIEPPKAKEKSLLWYVLEKPSARPSVFKQVSTAKAEEERIVQQRITQMAELLLQHGADPHQSLRWSELPKASKLGWSMALTRRLLGTKLAGKTSLTDEITRAPQNFYLSPEIQSRIAK